MSPDLFRAVMWASVLILAGILPANAQTPQSRSITGAVQWLGLTDDATGTTTAGRIRELRCRGKAGIDLRVQQEPSPRQPKLVAVELRYERPKETRVLTEGMGSVDHFSTWMLYRPGHPPFSVPWSDIKATRDGWPWFPLKGTPVVRLTIARYPTLRILMPRMVGERIIAESGHLHGARATVTGTMRAPTGRSAAEAAEWS